LHCGCVIPFDEKRSPICPTHELQVIVRVLNMPKPRIRGTATGPLVQTEDLPAYVGPLGRNS
jgi:hypothetical protein